MKRESRLLLAKAVDSLVLAIEHFNRPWDRGRIDAVLLLLDQTLSVLRRLYAEQGNGYESLMLNGMLLL